MIEILETYVDVVKFILQAESVSMGARVNLIGGIITFVGCILVILGSVGSKLINAMLRLLKREPLPEMHAGWFLAMVVFILVYFHFCARLLT